MTKLLSAVGMVFVLAGFAIYVTACPCERLPGMWLTGPELIAPQDDWTFVNSEGLCELEVRSWRAHSVTLNCMSDNAELFISCSRCDGKYWSGVALEQPGGRIRIAGQVYPVTLTRVTRPSELDRAWNARARKLDRQGQPRPDHWWSFQLISR